MRKTKGKIMAEEQIESSQQQPGKAPDCVNETQLAKHDGMTLMLGILAIVTALIFPVIGIVLGVLGLAFSVKDRKAFGPMACKAGFVCSIVGLSLSGTVLALSILCFVASYQVMAI